MAVAGSQMALVAQVLNGMDRIPLAAGVSCRWQMGGAAVDAIAMDRLRPAPTTQSSGRHFSSRTAAVRMRRQ